MEITTESIRGLAWSCEEFLDERGEPRSISYPGSLALCILDALYSTGSHPTAVDNLISRYTDRRGATDGAKSLRYSIAASGGPDKWAQEVIHNLRPVNVQPGAMLRAEVVDRATRVMADHSIDTVDDLLAAVGDEPCTGRRINAVARDWRALPSQRSGLSWRNLLMLAGSEHFDIDSTVMSSIVRSAGWYPLAYDDYVPELIGATADFLGVEEQEIRRIIWQIARRRLRQNPKREMCPWPYGLELEAGEEEDAEGWVSQFAPEEPQSRSGRVREVWDDYPHMSAAPF